MHITAGSGRFLFPLSKEVIRVRNDYSAVRIPIKTPEAFDIEGGKYGLRWALGVQGQFSPDQLVPQGFELDRPGVTVQLTLEGASSVHLLATANQGVEPTEAWDWCIRTILVIERSIAPVITIEGYDRDEWKNYFLWAERSGGLDRDKTPLMLAAQRGDFDRVRECLIGSGSAAINEISLYGATALLYAACFGQLEIVRFLLSAGAEVNIFGGECTPLQLAMSGGLPIVKELIASGVNLNARNRYGETGLMYAAARGDGDIVELLLSHGADVAAKDRKGNTALDWAKKSRNPQVPFLNGRYDRVIGYLVEAGNSRDGFGWNSDTDALR